jgi:biopolymer transport protein ExbD/biopolymer transport protein TolR
MGAQIGGTSEYNSEINVTPMVDVMLVLLIIFMIVTPLLQQGVSVNIPRDMNTPEEDGEITKDTSVVISIPNNSDFYVGKDPLPLTELGEKVKSMMKTKHRTSALYISRAASRSITERLFRPSTPFASRRSIRSAWSRIRKRELSRRIDRSGKILNKGSK